MRPSTLTWDQARRRDKERAYDKLSTVEENLLAAARGEVEPDSERLLILAVLLSEARQILRRVTV